MWAEEGVARMGGGLLGVGGGLCGGEGVRRRWVWWSVGSGVIFLRFTRCPRTLWPYELSDPRDALLMPQGVSLQQGPETRPFR